MFQQHQSPLRGDLCKLLVLLSQVALMFLGVSVECFHTADAERERDGEGFCSVAMQF
jgi:hypothetical protein